MITFSGNRIEKTSRPAMAQMAWTLPVPFLRL
jgi:hypothetical protein